MLLEGLQGKQDNKKTEARPDGGKSDLHNLGHRQVSASGDLLGRNNDPTAYLGPKNRRLWCLPREKK